MKGPLFLQVFITLAGSILSVTERLSSISSDVTTLNYVSCLDLIYGTFVPP